MNSNYTTFFIIGNTTVFNGTTDGEESITIDDSTLSSLLDYNQLIQKSIPIRVGLDGVSYAVNWGIDAYSIAELSGSMNQNVPEVGKKVLELVQEGNEAFVTTMLNDSDNNVGLVGYAKDAEDETQIHSLTNDILSLNNTIYSWKPGSAACTCCGINKAVERMLAESSSIRYQTIVVMSDGKANEACETGDAKQDAINAACRAYNDHGIPVYVVGFGPTTTIDEVTLQAIANCGNGTYYYSNATGLVEAYEKIAEDIINAAYEYQTITFAGDISTILYPDSYIEFDYNKGPAPYGLITTTEKKFDDEYSGTFMVPADSNIVEATAISYSGARWTSGVKINGNLIYNLSEYGEDYIKLGDPYAVNIPNSLVEESNSVEIFTGISPANFTYGSPDNKIIYTLGRDLSSFSDIVKFADGCIWNIEFEK